MQSSMYTPQMVVNGRRIVSGAHRADRVLADVADGYGRSDDHDIEVELPGYRSVPGGIAVRYRLRGAPADVALTIVVAENSLSNYVPRGENAGRTLSHINVVRGLATTVLRRRTLEHDGTLTVELSAGVDLANSTVVALIQSVRSQRVLAATSMSADAPA